MDTSCIVDYLEFVSNARVAVTGDTGILNGHGYSYFRMFIRRY